MDQKGLLIIGANGQLATALREQYPDAAVAGSKDLDITDAAAVKNYDWGQVTTILNASGYTNVDGSETPEGRIAAWKLNAVGVRNLAEAAIQHDLTIVHVSTDYVFDGSVNPHLEDEPLSPLGVYGQTKAAGDVVVSLVPKHYILRVSWVIGEGKNFVRTMLGLGQKGIAPTVVADQIGRLTFTEEIVRAIDHLLTKLAPYGTYNASNDGGSASWAQITREIFRFAGYDLTVTDTTTAEYFAGKEGIATRPLHSVFDLQKLHATGFKSTDWLEALETYVKKEVEKS